MAIGLYGPEYLQFDTGGPAAEVEIFVFLPGTKTKAVLWADATGLHTGPNPVWTDRRGELTFFADIGNYDLYYSFSDTTISVSIDDTVGGLDDLVNDLVADYLEANPPAIGTVAWEHTVSSPQTLVQIVHTMDFKPHAVCIDSLGIITEYKTIEWPEPGVVEIGFGADFGPGKIYLS